MRDGGVSLAPFGKVKMHVHGNSSGILSSGRGTDTFCERTHSNTDILICFQFEPPFTTCLELDECLLTWAIHGLQRFSRVSLRSQRVSTCAVRCALRGDVSSC
jgi:hypothetical protein